MTTENLEERLIALEDQHEEDRTNFIARIEALEEELAADKLHAVNREREERKARWWSSYDAALMSVGEGDTPEETASSIEYAHRLATMQADRAHGSRTPETSS